jgi:hypothetical protein
MDLTQQNLKEALQLLGDLLASKRNESFWLVVCGGSALLAQKIISRSTEDVDILAMRDFDGGVDRAYPMPEALKLAATEVATELHLRENWLNSAASFHFPDLHLLPNTFWQELENRNYGDYLKISFVSRRGQIQLKLYAALNRDEPRDLADLKALAPDALETESGLRWIISSVPALTHLNRLPELLTYIGHAELITKFER